MAVSLRLNWKIYQHLLIALKICYLLLRFFFNPSCYRYLSFSAPSVYCLIYVFRSFGFDFYSPF